MKEKLSKKTMSDASCILLASKLHLSLNSAAIVAQLSDSDVIWQQKSMNTQLATRRRCSDAIDNHDLCVVARAASSATGSMNPALSRT